MSVRHVVFSGFLAVQIFSCGPAEETTDSGAKLSDAPGVPQTIAFSDNANNKSSARVDFSKKTGKYALAVYSDLRTEKGNRAADRSFTISLGVEGKEIEAALNPASGSGSQGPQPPGDTSGDASVDGSALSSDASSDNLAFASRSELQPKFYAMDQLVPVWVGGTSLLENNLPMQVRVLYQDSGYDLALDERDNLLNKSGEIIPQKDLQSLHDAIKTTVFPRMKAIIAEQFSEKLAIQGNTITLQAQPPGSTDNKILIILSSLFTKENGCYFDYRDTFVRGRLNPNSNGQFVVYCGLPTAAGIGTDKDFLAQLTGALIDLRIFAQKYSRIVQQRGDASFDREEAFILNGLRYLAFDLMGYNQDGRVQNAAGAYLQNPNGIALTPPNSVSPASNEATGLAYLFVRFLFDTYGGEAANTRNIGTVSGKGIDTVFKPLFGNSGTMGFLAIEAATGSNMPKLYEKFTTALLQTTLATPPKDFPFASQISDETTGAKVGVALGSGGGGQGLRCMPFDEAYRKKEFTLRPYATQFLLYDTAIGRGKLVFNGRTEDQLHVLVMKVE